jgi:hypothetical protein
MPRELALTPESPPLTEEDLDGIDEIVISDGYGNQLEENIRFANSCRKIIHATTAEAQKFMSVVFSGA